MEHRSRPLVVLLHVVQKVGWAVRARVLRLAQWLQLVRSVEPYLKKVRDSQPDPSVEPWEPAHRLHDMDRVVVGCDLPSKHSLDLPSTHALAAKEKQHALALAIWRGRVHGYRTDHVVRVCLGALRLAACD